MPKVLVISRYFPPLGSAGASIRLVKLMKFTSKQGWNFMVLTQDLQRTVIPENELCGFLLGEVPEETEIVRVSAPSSGNGFWQRLFQTIFKDSSLPWGFAVAKQGCKVINRSNPDLIFVNSPPFTNVAIGMLLSIRYRIPFVLDLKDDWVGSTAFLVKRRIRQQMEKWIERIFFKRASAIITPTESSYEHVKMQYSGSDIETKVNIIPNGVDLEEYKLVWGQERKPASDKFLIVSAAAGYKPEYRDLSPFLQSIEKFLNRCPQARQQVELTFLGEIPDSFYKKTIEKILPPQQVFYKSAMARSEFVDALSQADLFLLVQPKNNKTAVSGTLYEYWATGNAPVLLFSEAGASSELVIKNKIGSHFFFDQVENASVYIEQVFKLKKVGTPVQIDHSGIESFDRQVSANKMIQIWNDIISRHRRD